VKGEDLGCDIEFDRIPCCNGKC